MTITAKIIADSVSGQGKRITTLQLRYPKFIHGEFMTHRVFSRNASSSRAIPVDRLVQDIMNDPVRPSFWGKNQAGMQAREEMLDGDKMICLDRWDDARVAAIASALSLHALGAHKQIVNRILEPFAHINVVVTATEWSNFFALRCHPDAQPEIRILAEKIREARDNSVPQALYDSDWHTPYVERSEWEAADMRWDIAVKLSVARCARVSYLTHDGNKPDHERDLALYDRLISTIPLHASPAEHQARPDIAVPVYGDIVRPGLITHHTWSDPRRHGNFVGWIQYRKALPGESQ